jgi:hypothetical protein
MQNRYLRCHESLYRCRSLSEAFTAPQLLVYPLFLLPKSPFTSVRKQEVKKYETKADNKSILNAGNRNKWVTTLFNSDLVPHAAGEPMETERFYEFKKENVK